MFTSSLNCSNAGSVLLVYSINSTGLLYSTAFPISLEPQGQVLENKGFNEYLIK